MLSFGTGQQNLHNIFPWHLRVFFKTCVAYETFTVKRNCGDNERGESILLEKGRTPTGRESISFLFFLSFFSCASLGEPRQPVPIRSY